MEIGSLAEIISAVGTIAAVVAASVAGRAALHANRQQALQLEILEKAENERREDQRRRQADRVAFWVTLNRDTGHAQVAWANRSGLPIFNCICFVTTPYGTVDRDYAVFSPISEIGTRRGMDELLLTTFANEVASWEDLLTAGKLRAAMIFQDSAEQVWYRGYFGNLSQQPNRQSAVEAERTDRQSFLHLVDSELA